MVLFYIQAVFVNPSLGSTEASIYVIYLRLTKSKTELCDVVPRIYVSKSKHLVYLVLVTFVVFLSSITCFDVEYICALYNGCTLVCVYVIIWAVFAKWNIRVMVDLSAFTIIVWHLSVLFLEVVFIESSLSVYVEFIVNYD